MKYLTLCIITTMILVMGSCKKDNGNRTTNPAHTKPKNYKITVVDETNNPIGNAKISDGSNTITSSAGGTATFNTPKETYGKYRLSIIKDGYFAGSLNLFNFADPDSSYKVMLLKSTDTINLASSGDTVANTGWT